MDIGLGGAKPSSGAASGLGSTGEHRLGGAAAHRLGSSVSHGLGAVGSAHGHSVGGCAHELGAIMAVLLEESPAKQRLVGHPAMLVPVLLVALAALQYLDLAATLLIAD
ncbi:hypothetical protein PC129_g22248 [Phytophthora cactorum]|uniref:Uncharacterized protein n=2 Tax=Phytophthora cactorum TaxID=29920 RepID=A0A8T1AYI5_9STRA|nr:hypothetical protein PC111_g13513 [Phytophthora cactorum]KAG2850772.1 hypothetical protein PC113_g16478 [Phytophthora cactorum]KAG2889957.1 hypothetical protein PC115_g19609 [Phytophthora cactorum]KAG2986790.1 hypothetical protein PC118_g7638 [Phytophthora cactorum]KAG3054877.1 hypothetical protein PC121_g16084 [Phytophthora cactorum]